MIKHHMWQYNGVAPWDEIINWCRENLWHGGNYEPDWYTDGYCHIYFKSPQEYVLFLLRWQ